MCNPSYSLCCPVDNVFDVFMWLVIIKDLVDLGRDLRGGYLVRWCSVGRLKALILKLVRLYVESQIRVSPLSGPLNIDGFISIDVVRRRRAEKIQNRCAWFRDRFESSQPQSDDFDYLGLRWMQEGKFAVLDHPTDDWCHPAWAHPEGLLSVYDL
ncbi:uncharacterized protein LOC141525725 [Cotesia typhae]|uniref:uncharacterized protein LOC141525725 n=1 Tax=Cotesia typhae TaxID=2053667 RepID=UPI003D68570B